MDSLERLEEIARDPYGYARRFQEKTGRPVVGCLCSYAPVEIVHAAGALPLRLFGDAAPMSFADDHLQAYSCSLVRGVLADALAGNLAFLSGAVFPHTCDSMQRLSDLWRMNAGFSFHADLELPVKLDTESARQYMKEVLRRFAEEIGEAFGAPLTDDRLRASAAVYNRIRTSLAGLYRIRQQRPETLSSEVLYTAVQAAMAADPEEAAGLLEDFQSGLAAAPAKESGGQRKRLLFSGGICRVPNVYRIVEAAGAAVVDDDLCTGRRYFQGAVEEQEDVLSAVAARYARRVVCPAKHSGLAERSEALLAQVKESRADGVVFFFVKFCDPHGFDYPHLKAALAEKGVPSLLLEIEEPVFASGQLATRIEAFVENL